MYTIGQAIRTPHPCRVGIVQLPQGCHGKVVAISEAVGKPIVLVRFENISEILAMWPTEIEPWDTNDPAS